MLQEVSGSFAFCLQSVLGKMNEIAKHKAAIEDAETQNKVGVHSHSAFVCDAIEKMSAEMHESVQHFVHTCPECAVVI